MGGGLVGVWNGWGYGIAFFWALNFQISEPEIGENRSFCGIYRILLQLSAFETKFSDTGKWSFHTPPIHTPTKCRPKLGFELLQLFSAQGGDWGNPRQPMKLHQPRNYDFEVFQFNLLVSQGGNSREMTTSPPGHHWEATVALTTAAKLLQFRANSREMTSQKLNNRCHRSMRFCVTSWLLSFQVPLGILWVTGNSFMSATFFCCCWSTVCTAAFCSRPTAEALLSPQLSRLSMPCCNAHAGALLLAD